MRLDFNILWIDDQPKNIKSAQDSVSIRLGNEGFKLVAHNALNIEDALGYLKESVFLDEVDLVLVDYDLGGSYGDVALRDIRDKLPYRDIIFYSAVAPTKLRKLAFDQNVEGVYCASREDLVDSVVGVFETLVKKIIDFDHSRGIILGATSGIDVIVHDCLLAINSARNAQEKEELLAQAQARVRKIAEEYHIIIKKVLAKENVVDLLDERSALTADQKLRFLIALLKKNKDLEPIRKELINYRDIIIPFRNILAHAKFELEGKVFTTNGGKNITSEEIKNHRRELLSYRETFNNLLDSFAKKE